MKAMVSCSCLHGVEPAGQEDRCSQPDQATHEERAAGDAVGPVPLVVRHVLAVPAGAERALRRELPAQHGGRRQDEHDGTDDHEETFSAEDDSPPRTAPVIGMRGRRLNQMRETSGRTAVMREPGPSFDKGTATPILPSMTSPRVSGLLLHPTSLPGRYGIGDLGVEAHRFLEFLEQAGQRVWQVLPLGPTGYGDSPYQCFSAMAGNPLLVSPERLVAGRLARAT